MAKIQVGIKTTVNNVFFRQRLEVPRTFSESKFVIPLITQHNIPLNHLTAPYLYGYYIPQPCWMLTEA